MRVYMKRNFMRNRGPQISMIEGKGSRRRVRAAVDQVA